jgi:hypothetical protein
LLIVFPESSPNRSTGEKIHSPGRYEVDTGNEISGFNGGFVGYTVITNNIPGQSQLPAVA